MAISWGKERFTNCRPVRAVRTDRLSVHTYTERLKSGPKWLFDSKCRWILRTSDKYPSARHSYWSVQCVAAFKGSIWAVTVKIAIACRSHWASMSFKSTLSKCRINVEEQRSCPGREGEFVPVAIRFQERSWRAQQTTKRPHGLLVNINCCHLPCLIWSLCYSKLLKPLAALWLSIPCQWRNLIPWTRQDAEDSCLSLMPCAGFQMNERYLNWDTAAQAQLLKLSCAAKLELVSIPQCLQGSDTRHHSQESPVSKTRGRLLSDVTDVTNVTAICAVKHITSEHTKLTSYQQSHGKEFQSQNVSGRFDGEQMHLQEHAGILYADKFLKCSHLAGLSRSGKQNQWPLSTHTRYPRQAWQDESWCVGRPHWRSRGDAFYGTQWVPKSSASCAMHHE